MKAELTSSGKYRARAYNKYTGKQKTFTSKSKKDAERQAQLYMMQIKEELDNGITLCDAVDMYIQSHKHIWTSKRTAKDYEGYKKHYDYLLDRPLETLSDVILQLWVNEQAKKYSPKYIKNMFSLICTLKTTYSSCVRVSVKRPKVTRAVLNLPAEADVKRYLTYVETVEQDKEMGGMTVPAYLASLCAMRRGEIAGLSLKDVDFENGLLNIRHSLAEDTDGGYYLKPPKNGHPRTIKPPQIVIDKIKQYGVTNLNLSQLSKRQARVVKEVGASFGLHALRHYCASRLLSIGCPIADVQEYGGWEDTKVLMEIYNYVINESRLKTQEKWNDYANTLMQELEN